MTDPTGQLVVSEGNAVAEAEAYLESYQQGLADAESFSYQDTTIADETASTGNTTSSQDTTTGDITQTVVNPDGSSTTTSFYPTDTGYQKAAGAFSNPASDGQLHPVNGGILAAQYGIQHKPGAGELPSGSTKGSQPGKGPQPQAGNGGQGSKPPTTKPTAPSPEGDGGNTNKKVVIDNNKFRYIFGKATGRQHNLDRSNGMALQMKRLGVLDNSDCIGLLTDNLQAAALDDTNVTSTRSTEWGTFIEKESLFAGPSGKFALFRSIWQLGADGELCFSSLMVLGG
ncbi:MAG TPA: hypothetical protein VNG51_04340 [Ktedonobacteraceae bacterium]|nr:hypothetical protein [Ktedonobacteraceae bacterium]